MFPPFFPNLLRLSRSFSAQKPFVRTAIVFIACACLRLEMSFSRPIAVIASHRLDLSTASEVIYIRLPRLANTWKQIDTWPLASETMMGPAMFWAMVLGSRQAFNYFPTLLAVSFETVPERV